MRQSGVLMPVSALPSRYGIGAFSKEAYEFIDQLKKAGQKKWQLLPLGPTGYGDSPYQPFSTYAGNPYYIDLEALIEEKLLTEEECGRFVFGQAEDKVDYGQLYQTRFQVLEIAYQRFKGTIQSDRRIADSYQLFLDQNAFWLKDYCLFMAIKKEQGDVSWTDWPLDLKLRQPDAVKEAEKRLDSEIDFYNFIQYEFYQQWDKLHRYANDLQIELIGDMPIYVSMDSADVWAHPEVFQLEEDLTPKAVAGCPPDGFTADGQLWGNPLYDWEYQRKTDYIWWVNRIAFQLGIYDILRVDHFRGFDAYYAIPYGDVDARNGVWKKGPGMELFDRLKERLGDVRIIAEDLGFLTDSVRELVKQTGYPGMKILQFAFDPREQSDYLPYHYEKNCVVYTGTHDNNTIQGWFTSLDPETKDYVRSYLDNSHTPEDQIYWDFIRLSLSSVADLSIIPVQDLLGLGEEARINVPSTLGGNWTWRLKKGQLSEESLLRFRRMTKVYGRG